MCSHVVVVDLILSLGDMTFVSHLCIQRGCRNHVTPYLVSIPDIITQNVIYHTQQLC